MIVSDQNKKKTKINWIERERVKICTHTHMHTHTYMHIILFTLTIIIFLKHTQLQYYLLGVAVILATIVVNKVDNAE